MVREKKGQAALEYLLTYGWAFLVIVIMVGALTFFGVLSPDRFLPQWCNAGPEFRCEEFRVQRSTGLFDLKFSSTIGHPFSITDVILVGHSVEAIAEPVNDYPAVPALGRCSWPDEAVSAGSEVHISCRFNNATFPAPGGKLRVVLDMRYLEQGRQWAQPLTVEVYATVSP